MSHFHQTMQDSKLNPVILDMTQHRPAVRGFVLRLIGDDPLVEDLTQETFLRAQRSIGTYRSEASEHSWLCSIALNLVRDHFRSFGRVPDMTTNPDVMDAVPSGDDDAEQALLLAEMSNCIGEFLARLPRSQYDVVALYDMGGFSHQEIAAQLGISISNSRVLLHRGRDGLRDIFKRGCKLSFGSDVILCERNPQGEK